MQSAARARLGAEPLAERRAPHGQARAVAHRARARVRRARERFRAAQRRGDLMMIQFGDSI